MQMRNIMFKVWMKWRNDLQEKAEWRKQGYIFVNILSHPTSFTVLPPESFELSLNPLIDKVPFA